MTVVFKLGGSLLTLPGLEDKLRFVVSQRPGERCLILVGGGASTDVVREWSRTHHLSDETSHWLAISSLDLNRQLLESLLPWRPISTRADAESLWSERRSPLLLDVAQFSKREEADGCEPLPHNWDVTSDSLAAWAAVRWPADEFILLKSVPTPHGLTSLEASRRELVDPYFPQLSKGLPRILWCNLRASKIEIEPWLAKSADSSETTNESA